MSQTCEDECKVPSVEAPHVLPKGAPTMSVQILWYLLVAGARQLKVPVSRLAFRACAALSKECGVAGKCWHRVLVSAALFRAAHCKGTDRSIRTTVLALPWMHAGKAVEAAMTPAWTAHVLETVQQRAPIAPLRVDALGTLCDTVEEPEFRKLLGTVPSDVVTSWLNKATAGSNRNMSITLSDWWDCTAPCLPATSLDDVRKHLKAYGPAPGVTLRWSDAEDTTGTPWAF